MRRQLVICRHTQTDDNDQRRYTGQHDILVNPTGVMQARKLAKIVGALPGICGIISSDLRRTRMLAQMIGRVSGHEPVFDPRLREAAVGQLETLTREEIDKRFPGQDLRTSVPTFDFRHIGGERASDVIRRQLLALRDAAPLFGQGSGPIRRLVIVGHGTALRLLFRDHFGAITALHEQGEHQEVEWPF